MFFKKSLVLTKAAFDQKYTKNSNVMFIFFHLKLSIFDFNYFNGKTEFTSKF